MNRKTRYVIRLIGLLAFLLLASFLTTPVNADWLNFNVAENAPTIAEIYINDNHIKVILEMYIHDLKAFIDVLPEDFFKENDVEFPPLDVRLRRFSSEVLQCVTEDGEHLQTELLVTEPRMRTQRPSPLERPKRAQWRKNST